MNNPAMHKATKRNKFHAIENPMSEKIEKIMDTQTMRPAASNSKQKFMPPRFVTLKFVKGCATCAAFLALALTAPPVHAAAASNSNTAIAAVEEQQGKQRSGDRVVVTLSDPSRPSTVKASLINGGITVKAYEGKDIIVEAHPRNRDDSDDDNDRPGPKRLNIATTGLNVEEENNQVNIGADAIQRPIDLVIQVPVHTSLHLRAVNDGDIMVTGVDGEFDVDDINGSVTLNKIAGSAVAHALNGKLLVSFTRINQKPMAFSSLNGDIDVTFPADLKANVSLRSDNGDVFSDFDVNMTPQSSQPVVEDGRSHGGKYKVKIDKTVRGSINGGGPEMQFTNFNGGIYIRKSGSK
jgi:DUF4097 and DUF4098 domain-containing protein YvlB